MNKIVLALLALALPLAAQPAMKTEEELIDDYLARCDDYHPSWLGATITAAQLVSEDDAGWALYLALFRKTLEDNGLGDREDLVASKEKVRAGWLRQRAVFLQYLESKFDLQAHRYNGGDMRPCGYVLIKEGKPFRILSVRINRPDPNIGNQVLPFP
jgi:hypothetical protein